MTTGGFILAYDPENIVTSGDFTETSVIFCED